MPLTQYCGVWLELPVMQGDWTWLLVVVLSWVWVANWAAVTPIRAAARIPRMVIARIIFVCICFSPQVSIGVGAVWMLAETDVKRFLKRFSMVKTLFVLKKP